MGKVALVVGATGLVGRNLLQQLLLDDGYSRVIAFVRRYPGIAHGKLETHLINFDEPASWQKLVKGDVLFSALGTTIKQAGSQQNQYKIDYTYQYNFAAAAANNGVPVYVLVSSAGADAKSRIFYSRMKGELEAVDAKLPFQLISLLQPGLLVGEREQTRTGEKTAYKALTFFNKLGLFKKYRPIGGATVAKAMINAAKNTEEGLNTYSLDKVFSLAER